MPEVISCPECEKKLRVSDETLGKKVKCPNCNKIFVARAGGAAPPAPPPSRSSAIEPTPTASSRKRPILSDELEEEDEDLPRRSRRDEDDEDFDDRDDRDEDVGRGSRKWQSVRGGLNLVAISLLVFVGAVILVFAVSFVVGAMMVSNAAQNAANQGPGKVNIAAATSSFTTGLYIAKIMEILFVGAAFALNLMGHQKIMGIPDRNRVSTRTLALVTFIFVCGLVGFWFLNEILGLFTIGAITSGNLTGLSTAGNLTYIIWASTILYEICLVTSGITFLLVMRNICLAFGNRGFAKTVMSFLISACSVGAVGLLLVIIAIATVGLTFFGGMNGMGPGNAQAAGGVMIGIGCFALLLMLVSLGLFIWYIILVFQVRGVLDNALRPRFD